MKQVTTLALKYLRGCLVSLAVFQLTLAAPLASAAPPSNNADTNTKSPIKHVIVIIGENRTFDHVFATYKPTRPHETVWNLLSEGIIKEDGSKGSNFGSGGAVLRGRCGDV